MEECIVRKLINGERNSIKKNDILKPDGDG